MSTPSLPASGIVRAIVLDANTMSRGRLDLDVVVEIIGVIQDRELETEVWIPEPVLWEWAEHAHAELKTHAEKHLSLRDSLTGAGLADRLPELAVDILDIESIVVDIEDNLESREEVQILRVRDHPNSAYGGLRDQILQVGAGRTKGASGKSVKTGASDGTICRLIEMAGEGGLRDVVLISGDGDANRYFFGRDAPEIYLSWSLLRAELISLRPRDEVASENFAALTRELLVSSDLPSIPHRSIEARNEAVQAFLSAERYLETTMSISAIRAIDDVSEIEISEGGDFATAVISATVDVELVGLGWNDMDDVLVEDSEPFYDLQAELSVEARLRHGVWSFSVVDGSILGDSP